jgi:hypothetical protein
MCILDGMVDERIRAPSETLRARLALVAAGLLFLAPRPAASQVTATPDPTLLPTTLVVTVRSPSAPVAGASITIAGTSAGVVSSSEGRAVLAALPGRRFIHVRALGFEPFDSLLLVGSALAISLRRAAVQLDSVRVTASNVGKPARYAATTKFDGFYERRATAIGGTFLTREDIERTNQDEAVGLLRAVPGVQITSRSGMAPLVYFPRCSSGANRSPYSIGKSDPIGNGGKELLGLVQLFVDGNRVSNPFTTLAALRADDIEAMEVYRGVAELPSVARGDACAAIFVWTRYGGGSVTHPKQP